MLEKFSRYFFIIAASSAAIAAGQTPPAVSEFDPGINVGIELNRRVRLDFYAGRERTEELASSKGKVGAGASLRAKPLLSALWDDPDADKQHVLVIGGLYEFARASEADVTQHEHKVMADATGRWAFGERRRYVLSDRSRFEFRWLSGDYRFRYRNRLVLERNTRFRKLRLTPYLAAEAFWDKDFGKWNQFRYTGGSTVRLFRRTYLDVYYERGHCSTCSYPNTNVLGAAVNLFFRHKK